MTFAAQIVEFYENFKTPHGFPNELNVHNPWADAVRKEAIKQFCAKFYDDAEPRVHVVGINPSRLTPTSTGVNYTDGYALDHSCGIPNDFSKTRELTAEFFYMVVEAAGGAQEFYKKCFAWALMPLPITLEQTYKNHYDADVNRAADGIIEENFAWMRSLPSTKKAVVLGKGENAKKFLALNEKTAAYSSVKVLPHPRWVLQYNRAEVGKYIEEYLTAIG